MSPIRSAARGRVHQRVKSFAGATQELVADFRRRRPLRASSLLVSVFGDAIAPRGGCVWLGSLIRALEFFGVNQRLVRTSIFRLARDGWLESELVGRRSYYRLTDVGRERIDDASRHIYALPEDDWPGEWTLVLLSRLPAAQREAVRKKLGWLGFAPFSSGLLAHPSPDRRALTHALTDLPGSERLLTLTARAGDDQAALLNRLVHDAWSLDELAGRYADFAARFAAVHRSARRARRLDPAFAFQTRTLLIHEYRKIVLRDPLLPGELLPADWAGHAANRLCRELYARVRDAAEDYIDAAMETAAGPLPDADEAFRARFRGPAQR